MLILPIVNVLKRFCNNHYSKDVAPRLNDFYEQRLRFYAKFVREEKIAFVSPCSGLRQEILLPVVPFAFSRFVVAAAAIFT